MANRNFSQLSSISVQFFCVQKWRTQTFSLMLVVSHLWWKHSDEQQLPYCQKTCLLCQKLSNILNDLHLLREKVSSSLFWVSELSKRWFQHQSSLENYNLSFLPSQSQLTFNFPKWYVIIAINFCMTTHITYN